jgi:hypothetical protein
LGSTYLDGRTNSLEDLNRAMVSTLEEKEERKNCSMSEDELHVKLFSKSEQEPNERNLRVLMIVFSTQNHCVCGLCPTSGILKN